ncbi:hypothetical protein BCR41DRAFT_382590 [Lobosporangium transversale]|uniref:Uncharacterized protein n=1 Tax=Lobosporangium transversale TaxID=64571 RepID=A0A1Y2H209_9FUNG|nr:hypothetical protein BCR41DRAFT_382590 [Lobosporangium transversale]ORZ28597.1 hypothetical protein BCR41DRAFT_382590 [Lobosporangium transversale]|eukprot:XP_021886270.1 hypothetical protein BCR41DRAFT_382590 [Lobosporangium transversale]
MPSFNEAFNFTIEKDAHAAFSALISVTDISKRIRTRLQSDYDVWQRNNGDEYWASVAVSAQVSISTKRTAKELALGGEHIAKKLIREQASSSNNEIDNTLRMPSSVVGFPGPGVSEDAPPSYAGATSSLHSDDDEPLSSQSFYEPPTLSPDPPEEYLIERERFVLDMNELTGVSHTGVERRVHILDNFASLEERWLLSSIQVVDQHEAFPRSIRYQLPNSCRDAIDTFLVAQDEGKRYYFPRATNDMELEIYTILSCLSQSHGPSTSEACCRSKNQEMNFIIHHVCTIWDTIFNTHEGFSIKWYEMQ